MQVGAPLRRALRWSFGDLPAAEVEAGAGRLAVVLVSTGALAMLLGARHSFKKAPFAADTWSLAVHGALPLAALVWLGLGRTGRGRVLAALGSLAVGLPVAARLALPDAAHAFRAEPVLLLVPVALGIGCLLLAASRAGLDPGRWGVGVGDARWWLPRAGLLLAAMLVMVAAAAWAFPDLRAYYPQHRPARTSVEQLAYYQLSLGLYMLGWEFFFRGFLLFGMARCTGPLLAILFQAVPFFLLHRTKPEVEMVASFVGAVAIGWFCMRARTFLPAFGLHWAMNLAMSVAGFLWRNLGGP